MQHGSWRSSKPDTALKVSFSTREACNGLKLTEASMDGWINPHLFQYGKHHADKNYTAFELVTRYFPALLEILLL